MAAQSRATADAAPAARPSLTVTRRLRAQPEKVYAAWTEAEKLVQWFGPANVVPGTLRADLDIRVGGRYRISFTDAKGEYFEVGGVYREVVPNARLVFSWAWHSTPERESQVTISIRPDAAGSLLTVQHEQFADEAARDGHEKGWNELLTRLEQAVA